MTAPEVTPTPAPSRYIDSDMQAARSKQKQAAAAGYKGTIATSGAGDTSVANTQKTKLGS